jgi:predicted ATP-binding protein involved in virulence
MEEKEKTFITEINVEKVRHLEKLSIKLSETQMKHLILTGKNGSGKTSLLDKMNMNFNEYKSEVYPTEIRNKYGLSLAFNHVNQTDSPLNTLLSYFTNERKLKVDKSKGINDTISKSVIDFEKFLAKKRTEQAFLSFEKNNENEVDKIAKWFNHIEKSLKYIFEDESLLLNSKRTKDLVGFYLSSDHREDFDFNTLSSGYSSALYILFDIIQQMDNDVNTDYNKNGIVLIDEIETHLHVSLQKKILPFLTSFFPNMQFIITTHSPFVLQSEPNAVIFDLETKKKYENFSNYSSESILETFYNMDKFSDSLKAKMEYYENLLATNEFSNGKKDKFLELRNIFLNIPDIEIDYWLKDTELKYIQKIKAVIND